MDFSGLWDTAAKKILLVLITALIIVLTCILGEVVYANLVNPSPPVSIIQSTDPIAVLPQNSLPTLTPFVSTNNNLSSHACRVNGPYPDPTCTPGQVFYIDKVLVCTSGYSQNVRDVTESMKNQVYSAYGITSQAPGQYEMDHFIPLELGGTNDPTNLFPEAADPRPGFHEKDKVENYLHDQVCTGVISLQQAQDMIKQYWVKVYNSMVGAEVPAIQPTIDLPPAGNQVCCKVCTSSKACGDSCISKDKTCTKPPGCACQGP